MSKLFTFYLCNIVESNILTYVGHGEQMLKAPPSYFLDLHFLGILMQLLDP